MRLAPDKEHRPGNRNPETRGTGREPIPLRSRRSNLTRSHGQQGDGSPPLPVSGAVRRCPRLCGSNAPHRLTPSRRDWERLIGRPSLGDLCPALGSWESSFSDSLGCPAGRRALVDRAVVLGHRARFSAEGSHVSRWMWVSRRALPWSCPVERGFFPIQVHHRLDRRQHPPVGSHGLQSRHLQPFG